MKVMYIAGSIFFVVGAFMGLVTFHGAETVNHKILGVHVNSCVG